MVGATGVVSGSKISVVCTCGSKGLFPQRLAGRKIKCRDCRQVLRIPAARAEVVSYAADERWLMQDSGDSVVLIPLATGDSDELRILPAHERKDWSSSEHPVRRGLRNDGPSRPRRRTAKSGSDAPNVRHHSHVRAIAFWYQASGVLLALAAVIGAMMLGSSAMVPGWLAPAVLFFGLGLAGLNWGLGYGLGRLRAWGRWIVIALSGINGIGAIAALTGAVNLPTLLVGLLPIVWHSAVLWALLGNGAKAVFGDYRKTARREVPFMSSPFFSIPAVLIALSLVLSLLLFASAIASITLSH